MDLLLLNQKMIYFFKAKNFFEAWDSNQFLLDLVQWAG